MRDLIDFGNLIFDELIKSHGEQQEGRELFLYSITIGIEFCLLGSNKRILVTQLGVTKNFEDAAIDEINNKWKSLVSGHREKVANNILKQIKSPGRQPKDGDIFNFWSDGNDEWKEIKL